MQIASQFAKQTFDGIDIKKEFLIYWIIDFSIDELLRSSPLPGRECTDSAKWVGHAS